MTEATRFVAGSIWMIGMRWAIRFAGLISTVILARLLTPEDFGIVAMCSLVFNLLQMCAQMGTAQLLLRTRETNREPYDTAWTITLIKSFLLAVAFFFVAEPVAVFFSEPRLVSVIQVVAIGSVLNGATNIGVVMFRRDLDFKRDFLFGFYSKVLTVMPTVFLALTYRNYWALVVGQIIGHLLEVLISYLMHPFRPRFRLADWRRFVVFSLWITPSTIANFLSGKADVFVVGHFASTSQMGIYSVASDLSRMATAEVVVPMSRALLPNYAVLKDNPAALGSTFLIVLRTVCIISFSFGFGIAAVAEDLVAVVLGDQWGSAPPLIVWLGVFGTFTAIFFTLTGQILIVLQHERTLLIINWIKLTVFLGSVLVAAQTGDVVNIAMAAALSTAAVTIASVIYLRKILPISAGRVLFDILTLFLSALVMVLVVRFLHLSDVHSHLVTLLIDTITGALVFVTLLGILWIAAGRPDGPERRILQLICAHTRLRTLRR